ncbi:MAG: hypothetical protein WC069_05920 [Candidatus Shapirobacteria bacterium]
MNNLKKKKILKKACGKGGLATSPFSEASSPINLLKTKGEPPTVAVIPKSKDNSSSNK